MFHLVMGARTLDFSQVTLNVHKISEFHLIFDFYLPTI